MEDDSLSRSVIKYTNSRQKSKQMQPPVIVMMMPPNQLQTAFGGAMQLNQSNLVPSNCQHFQPMSTYLNAFGQPGQPAQSAGSHHRHHGQRNHGGKMEVRTLKAYFKIQFFNPSFYYHNLDAHL